MKMMMMVVMMTTTTTTTIIDIPIEQCLPYQPTLQTQLPLLQVPLWSEHLGSHFMIVQVEPSHPGDDDDDGGGGNDDDGEGCWWY